MTGYESALTDPSYAGQILVFTYPLIGNYGILPSEQWESARIHAAGVVVSSACLNWSHGKGVESLLAWLERQRVPIIIGIDTRRLTKTLREEGAMPGEISSSPSLPASFDRRDINPGKQVSIDKPITYGNGCKSIIAVDCGMKSNIARNLQRFPIRVTQVPFDFDYTDENFDGILLSNGPGDPMTYQDTIAILKKAMLRKKPIFGICLGTQLLALAAGASTFKLRFGHRGHNQPCMDLSTGRCYMTSQNHGYAVDEESLPENWITTFRNLNDGTVEGIAHRTLPYSAVQFHPEAAPGPKDTEWMFEQFYSRL